MSLVFVKNFLDALVGSFFPISCLGCGADDYFVCSNCLKKINLRSFNDSWEKLVYDDYLDRIFIATWYEQELLQKMIINAKYKGQKELLHLLAKILIDFCKQTDLFLYFGQDIVLLPLPLHPRRLRERGYNQSLILAKDLVEFFSYPLDVELLKRKKYTKHQTDLSQEKRKLNLQGAFQINKNIKIVPNKVLLIDDVVTTGASLNEAAYILKQAGVEKVYALVIAKN